MRNSRGTGVAGPVPVPSIRASVSQRLAMEYDDGSRRLNLLSGMVLGTLLGAGLALLLVPGDGPAEKARFVVRAARRVGHGARRTHAWARDLHARLEPPGDAEEPADAEDAEDGDEVAPRRRRGGGMARRRFEL